MAEIANIKEQLEQIVSGLGLPILSGGDPDDYLTCVASGMIQFVCIREKRENYKSLTAEHIQIHPGSCMFRADPLYIVAGEIVKTSRMFAMSVSPLTVSILSRLSDTISERLSHTAGKRGSARTASAHLATPQTDRKDRADKADQAGESVTIGGTAFEIQKIKGKKYLIAPLELLQKAAAAPENPGRLAQAGKLRVKGSCGPYSLLSGERLGIALKAVKELDLAPLTDERLKKENIRVETQLPLLFESLPLILRTVPLKKGGKDLGFAALQTDGRGTYWFKITKNFIGALDASLSSLEVLIDEISDSLSAEQKERLNALYRKLNGLYE